LSFRAREELVEQAQRFLAVQQIARTRLASDVQSGRQAITIFLWLSILRRHLEQLGNGYQLNEIKEALDIRSGAVIEISPPEDQSTQQKGRRTSPRQRFVMATILSNYVVRFL
jgi:hypothetical protein